MECLHRRCKSNATIRNGFLTIRINHYEALDYLGRIGMKFIVSQTMGWNKFPLYMADVLFRERSGRLRLKHCFADVTMNTRTDLARACCQNYQLTENVTTIIIRISQETLTAL